jgi:TatD DNase family protein
MSAPPSTLPLDDVSLGLFDTHCHLADPALQAEVDAVLRRAASAGVSDVVAVGYDLLTSRRSLEISSNHVGVHAAVGIHPGNVAAMSASDLTEVAELASRTDVVAIGEIGLDYYRLHSPREDQIRAFEWQLTLAAKMKKPVIVHNRDADEDVLAILTAWSAGRHADGWNGPAGVLHCFGGTIAMARQAIGLGFLISFAGNVTYRSADPLRAVATEAPSDSLLLETDAPYLPPVPYRGRRCEPAHLTATASVVADARGLSLGELAATTTRNARRLFRVESPEATVSGARVVAPV